MPLSLPEDVHSSPTPAPARQRLFVAEIACLLCGRPVGTAMAESWPPCGPVAFRPADSTTERQLPTVSHLRCPLCGGNAIVDELDVRTLRLEATIDWRAERPRRGRPPKWLAQQRQADESDTAGESGGLTRCHKHAPERDTCSKQSSGLRAAARIQTTWRDQLLTNNASTITEYIGKHPSDFVQARMYR